MKWEKKGLIYKPPFDGSWKDNSALQPTVLVLSDRIRIFLCFRDTRGIGRIGYVDVDVNDPSKILKISENPILDIGQDGMFDDNGVAPTAIIKNVVPAAGSFTVTLNAAATATTNINWQIVT